MHTETGEHARPCMHVVGSQGSNMPLQTARRMTARYCEHVRSTQGATPATRCCHPPDPNPYTLELKPRSLQGSQHTPTLRLGASMLPVPAGAGATPAAADMPAWQADSAQTGLLPPETTRQACWLPSWLLPMCQPDSPVSPCPQPTPLSPPCGLGAAADLFMVSAA